jgi:hypothetical protein
MQRLGVSVLIGFVVTAFGAGAEAQTWPNMFSTEAACKAALESGRLRFYEPKYFGSHTRNPPNGYDRIVVPLESDTCLEMRVVGGRQFVAQREGTLFRAQKLADGSLSLYARDDCGNAVYGVVFPAPVPPAPVEVMREDVPPPSPRITIPRRFVPVPAPPVTPQKKGGFCSSKTCRWMAVVAGSAAAGYTAWYYWPCPPGTVRK